MVTGVTGKPAPNHIINVVSLNPRLAYMVLAMQTQVDRLDSRSLFFFWLYEAAERGKNIRQIISRALGPGFVDITISDC